MRAALAMGRRNLGQTWPNPSVGCVIVKDGRVLGRGTTAPGGRPHAEVVALAAAGPGAHGSTAYVTLEPCSHHGRTPPCADALIAAGVARVVIACNDPDPRVNGKGVARLRAAGIEVVENVLQAEAETQQRGFLTRIREGRPIVTLKLATTLDGRIATASGESQWITGAAARRYAHGLRASHDATLCGIGTVLADDPALTCRIAGLRRTPDLRIVLDTHLRTPLDAQLVTSARQSPTWILHHPDPDPARAEALSRAGVTLHAVPGSPDCAAALQVLGAAGLTRVLVEGGAGIAGSLLNADMVDRLAWFHAPGILGADAWPATRGFAPQTLAAMPRFQRIGTRHLGTDLLSEFERP
jgi:diaminohydroxyphosphoribosylaminopyrimidine deaminase/5-amino-6-(5-phosphoribosylamino)uracil reductase